MQALKLFVPGQTSLPVLWKEQCQSLQNLKPFCPWWLCKVVPHFRILAACLTSPCKVYLNLCFWCPEATGLLNLPIMQKQQKIPRVSSDHSSWVLKEKASWVLFTQNSWGQGCLKLGAIVYLFWDILGIGSGSKHRILLYFIQIYVQAVNVMQYFIASFFWLDSIKWSNVELVTCYITLTFKECCSS